MRTGDEGAIYPLRPTGTSPKGRGKSPVEDPKQSDKSEFKRLGPLLRRGPSRLCILSLGENLIRVQDEGDGAVILAVDLHIRSEFSVLWWEAPLLTFP